MKMTQCIRQANNLMKTVSNYHSLTAKSLNYIDSIVIYKDYRYQCLYCEASLRHGGKFET